MRFIKKPVVIEAIQLRWDTWHQLCNFADVGRLRDGKPEGCYVGEDGSPLQDSEAPGKIGLLIPTQGGLIVASEGDWIIRGVKGELYPCKPDIFEATYVPVEEVSAREEESCVSGGTREEGDE